MSKRRALKRTKDCHNSFSSAKPKKAATGKENRARFCFVDETKARMRGSSLCFTC